MTDITKSANEYFLTQAQYDARANAGQLEVGAVYHITDNTMDISPVLESKSDATNLENGQAQDSIKQRVTDQNESQNNTAGKFAAAIGHGNTADGKGSLAAGGDNFAYADHSAAIGYRNKASSGNALALGCRTTAVGDSAISAGFSQKRAPEQVTQNTTYSEIMAAYSHPQLGPFTLAQKYGAFAHGQDILALGQNSEAGGQGTIAFSEAQEAKGKFNEPKAGMARVTGWGSDDAHRKNIEELDTQGNLKVTGLTDGYHNETIDKTIKASAGYEYLKTFDYALECVSKCVSAVQKAFTSRDWDRYGAIGHLEVWTGTEATKKEAEGQYFALYGTVSDDSRYKRVIIAKSLGRNTSVDARAKGETVFYADESELVNRLLVALGVSESVEKPTKDKMLKYNASTKSIEFADIPGGSGKNYQHRIVFRRVDDSTYSFDIISSDSTPYESPEPYNFKMYTTPVYILRDVLTDSDSEFTYLADSFYMEDNGDGTMLLTSNGTGGCISFMRDLNTEETYVFVNQGFEFYDVTEFHDTVTTL